MPDVAPAPDKATAEDFLPIHGTDYVEFYVGNARQAAHFYATAFGFRITGYRGDPSPARDNR
jgi:4-hydroxyphenylpyruvate dioxygenase